MNGVLSFFHFVLRIARLVLRNFRFRLESNVVEDIGTIYKLSRTTTIQFSMTYNATNLILLSQP